MMTVLGKAFVFLVVCLSLVTVGLAVWVAADTQGEIANQRLRIRAEEPGISDQQLEQRSRLFWNEKHKQIAQANYDRQAALDKQRGALIVLLDEIQKGSRQMPWDPETGAAPKSVVETKKQMQDLGVEINRLFNEQNDLHVQLRGVVDELAKAHDDFKKAVAEHKSLREQIKPENPNQKGFRDLIDEHRAAKEAAEEGQERLKPDLVNELVRVQQIKLRLDELEARVKELKGKTSTSAKAK